MSMHKHSTELLAVIEPLEEIRSALQEDSRNNDDPTHAHRKLVEALGILHSIISDLEQPIDAC